jgi:hypothetical protein
MHIRKETSGFGTKRARPGASYDEHDGTMRPASSNSHTCFATSCRSGKDSRNAGRLDGSLSGCNLHLSAWRSHILRPLEVQRCAHMISTINSIWQRAHDPYDHAAAVCTNHCQHSILSLPPKRMACTQNLGRQAIALPFKQLSHNTHQVVTCPLL